MSAGASAATVRVVLCDDHAIVREGLARLLEVTDGIEVVATTAGGAEAVEAAARLHPDVVLMDLVMPDVDGVAATRRMAAEAPEARVVVLTSFGDRDQVRRALDAGASGYLLKDADAVDVVRAIHSAARGEAPIDPRAARAIVSGGARPDPTAGLSVREREVLALLGEGATNRIIARELGISEATVKAHLTRIYRHLGVDDRTQAALWARRNDVV